MLGKGLYGLLVIKGESFWLRQRQGGESLGGSAYTGLTYGLRLKRWSQRAGSRLRSMDHGSKVIALVMVAVVLYGSFIIIDGAGFRHWLDANFGAPFDLKYYQDRTSLILNGGIIYRDMAIESPPLINYLLVPAQLMGGDWWAYELYFSLYPLLTSLCIYFAMRRWDEYYAFLVALVFLVSPYAVVDATWGIQDEAIMVLFYFLPVLLMLVGSKRLSAAAVATGFWTKFMPVILYPITLIRLGSGRERLKHVGWVVAVSLLIAIPFLLVCPIEFLGFPSYYLLGNKGEGSNGMSIVNILADVGYPLPGAIGAAMTIATLVASYYLVYRWNLDLWRGAMLTTVMFLAVYPMLHMPYFILPFTFFIVWGVKDIGILLRSFLMYGILLFGQGFQMNGVPGLASSYAWVVALVLVIAGTLVMIDICRLCLKRRCFLDDLPEREGPSSA